MAKQEETQTTPMTQPQRSIPEDINTYLDRHQRKELLRFLTCGSVDDGKSTLIGRLLHDTKGIYDDQLAAVKKLSLIHISEPTRLLSISYAVFCLKKKKKN